MLTLFTIPKPFEGHIGTIQRNAIESWTRLSPRCQTLVFGDEEGTADAAKELGVEHIPTIETNEYGTPRLDVVFREARERSRFDHVCYVNADIILLDDLLQTLDRIPYDDFLAVGRRRNVDVDERLEMDDPGWSESLRARVAEADDLEPAGGSDLFLMPRRSSLDEMPPFLVGRPFWDNWMIFEGRRQGIPVIDITRTATMVHQNHGYDHVPEGTGEAWGGGDDWQGPEAEVNRRLAGPPEHRFILHDVTHVSTDRGVRPSLNPRTLWRRLKRAPVLIKAR